MLSSNSFKMQEVTMAAPGAFLAGHHQLLRLFRVSIATVNPSLLIPKHGLKEVLPLQGQMAGFEVSCAETERAENISYT